MPKTAFCLRNPHHVREEAVTTIRPQVVRRVTRFPKVQKMPTSESRAKSPQIPCKTARKIATVQKTESAERRLRLPRRGCLAQLASVQKTESAERRLRLFFVIFRFSVSARCPKDRISRKAIETLEQPAWVYGVPAGSPKDRISRKAIETRPLYGRSRWRPSPGSKRPNQPKGD